MTLGALLVPHQIDLLLAAEGRLLQGDGQVIAQVVARNRAVALGTAHAAAEEAGEDVLEAAKTAATEATAEVAVTAAAEALGAVVAELVVLRALLRVGQHLIGLVDLLEAFLRFLVARVDIGMVLLGEGAVRLFDRGVVRIFVYAQNLIIVSFSHMSPFFSFTIYPSMARYGRRAGSHPAPSVYRRKLYSVNSASTVPSSLTFAPPLALGSPACCWAAWAW